MSGRALLNVIEADMLDGLGEEASSNVRWMLSDPAGFAEAQAQERDEEIRAVALEAGGEIG